jgi:flavin reductase (DIM6/NTAB) family NADH-FMN oxidoreductase RutF
MRAEPAHITNALELPELPSDRAAFRYVWPRPGEINAAEITGERWSRHPEFRYLVRNLHETREELAQDSRWPGFFPSPLCLVTTQAGGRCYLEKVVGASIVNRFPYVLALSFCSEPLSDRHYVRHTFMDALDISGRVAVQFMFPGAALATVMGTIASVADERADERLARSGLPTRIGVSSGAPVFAASCLVYEGRLVQPGRDWEGTPMNQQPSIDIGSHRVYFFEIETISLRRDIAAGRQKLYWRSLPVWRGAPAATMMSAQRAAVRSRLLAQSGYLKSYQPDYVFPTDGTIAFKADEHRGDFAIMHLPPLAEDQVEIDNDAARWPCFFPSSLGLITSRARDGRTASLACGSTTILSRHPLTFAVCVSYARINARYAPRASLDVLADADRLGVSVPFYRSDVLEAIGYLGNVSGRDDAEKMRNCGLTEVVLGKTPAFAELPLHYDCRIVRTIPLGTHRMFLAEAERIFMHPELSEATPLEWCPWAGASAP